VKRAQNQEALATGHFCTSAEVCAGRREKALIEKNKNTKPVDDAGLVRDTPFTARLV
jgi:hypothetical protein